MRTLWALGLLHPAAILRGQWALAPAQVQGLKRVKQAQLDLQKNEEPLHYDTSRPAPHTNSEPTLEQLDGFLWGDLSQGVAVDIECAGPHLRCIGYRRVSDLVGILCPFRRQAGELYWGSESALLRAIRWNDRVLGEHSIPLVFHNGFFDVHYLRELGFRVSGYDFDTMYAQHVAYCEQPKALHYCSSAHEGIPFWKHLSKVEEEGDGK